MSVIRIARRERNFVTFDKSCLQDQHLSWRAKGLYAYLMSLPEDWVIRISDLVKRAKEGRDVVYAVMKELIQAGYLGCEHPRDDQGCFSKISYVAYETPQQNPDHEQKSKPAEIQDMVKIAEPSLHEGLDPHPETQEVDEIPDTVDPDTDLPYPVNRALLKNNNTKYTKTKKAAAEGKSPPGQRREVMKRERSAAASFVDEQDLIEIGNELTEAQWQLIHQTVTEQIPDPATAPEDLCHAIAEELLNPQCFSMAGRDFLKKLNTILRAKRQGKWTLRKVPTPDEERKRKRQLSELCCELSNLQGESERLQLLIDYNKQSGQISAAESLEKQRSDCQTKIEALRKRLHDFHANANENTSRSPKGSQSASAPFPSTFPASQGGVSHA